MSKGKVKQIKHLNNHKITSSDNFFFDSNIWIFLLNESGSNEPKIYSNFLQKILEKSAHIIVNNELISEVLNRFIKNDYFQNHKDLKFKEYRKTDDYRECYRVISALFEQLIANKVLIFKSIESTQEEFEYYIIENTKSRQKPILDYKDYIFDIFAQKNNFILVTDDGDFAAMTNADKILTANPKMVNKKVFN